LHKPFFNCRPPKSTENQDNTCQSPLPSAAHDHSTQVISQHLSFY